MCSCLQKDAATRGYLPVFYIPQAFGSLSLQPTLLRMFETAAEAATAALHDRVAAQPRSNRSSRLYQQERARDSFTSIRAGDRITSFGFMDQLLASGVSMSADDSSNFNAHSLMQCNHPFMLEQFSPSMLLVCLKTCRPLQQQHRLHIAESRLLLRPGRESRYSSLQYGSRISRHDVSVSKAFGLQDGASVHTRVAPLMPELTLTLSDSGHPDIVKRLIGAFPSGASVVERGVHHNSHSWDKGEHSAATAHATKSYPATTCADLQASPVQYLEHVPLPVVSAATTVLHCCLRINCRGRQSTRRNHVHLLP